jgi:archaellum component FlaF (FlaF/FlaG flagellin family)
MSPVPAYVAIFIIIVSSMFILVISHSEIMKQKIGEIEETYKIKEKKLLTDFEIEKVRYNNEIINIRITNIGSIQLNPNKFNAFMPLLIEGQTIIDEDFNLINPLFFDPGEKANLTINQEINLDENYTLTIVSENSISKKINFRFETKKLDILTAKTSLNNDEQKFNLNESDNIETEIIIETDSDAYLWINYSLDRISIQNSTIIIEHYFNDTNEIYAYLEYYSDNGWITIEQLSNFNSKNQDTFNFENEATEFRIRYLSNNLNNVISYIDKFEIIANMTIWWEDP